MRRLAAYTLGALTVTVGAAIGLYLVAVDWFEQSTNPDRQPFTDADWDEIVARHGIVEAD